MKVKCMRKIGTLPSEELSSRFIDYLLTEGIPARAEPIESAEDNGRTWVVWINREEQVEASRDILQHFSQSPDDPRYGGRAAKADALRMEQEKRRRFARENYHQGREIFRDGMGVSAKRTPVTFGLIAVCVFVALWTRLGDHADVVDRLEYVSRRHQAEENWNHENPVDASVDVFEGEYWRVFTPNFLHFSLIHIFFNMLWLRSLGGQIESRKGSIKLLAMVFALGLASTFCQVFVVRFPFFGGMSGVVYGLFGYTWMKDRFDPADGVRISPASTQMMVIWFVICFLPGFDIANGGHAGGLILGMIMGYASSHLRTRRAFF